MKEEMQIGDLVKFNSGIHDPDYHLTCKVMKCNTLTFDGYIVESGKLMREGHPVGTIRTGMSCSLFTCTGPADLMEFGYIETCFLASLRKLELKL